MVDNWGFEPQISACKADVFPLSLVAHVAGDSCGLPATTHSVVNVLVTCQQECEQRHQHDEKPNEHRYSE